MVLLPTVHLHWRGNSCWLPIVMYMSVVKDPLINVMTEELTG